MRSRRPTLRLDIARRLGTAPVLAAVLAVAVVGPAAGQSPSAAPVDIVVTTSVLGSVVTVLVGDRATVTVLMGNGTDPHDWSPSAQDIEKVHAADLVVESGLGLESVLAGVVDEVVAAGVPVFVATDHVTVRTLGPTDPTDAPPPSPGTAVADPHFWVDPVSMKAVVDALVPVIGGLGVDVTARGVDLDARLDALDAEVRTLLAPIPDASRKLVTGHESMGYFADRYGFTLVGAVIPGLSSQGEVSARQLKDLATQIQAQGVTAIFTEIGTPQSVVDAIGGATGVQVVQLPSHTMPADGSYFTFIREIATAIAGALT